MEGSPSEKETLNDMSFEEAYRQIEKIVNTLETGRGELEESLANYERAVQLVRLCRQKLDTATQRIELLKGLDAEGRPSLEPLNDADLQSKSDVVGRQSTPAPKSVPVEPAPAPAVSRARASRSCQSAQRSQSFQDGEETPPF